MIYTEAERLQEENEVALQHELSLLRQENAESGSGSADDTAEG